VGRTRTVFKQMFSDHRLTNHKAGFNATAKRYVSLKIWFYYLIQTVVVFETAEWKRGDVFNCNQSYFSILGEIAEKSKTHLAILTEEWRSILILSYGLRGLQRSSLPWHTIKWLKKHTPYW
jgi:hypothetical protein